MKVSRIILLIAAIAICAMPMQGAKKKTAGKKSASTTAAQPRPATHADYYSYDLQLNELFGHVKKLVQKSPTENLVVNFTQSGKRIREKDIEDQRDAKGRVVRTYVYADDGSTATITYEWDENGIPVSETFEGEQGEFMEVVSNYDGDYVESIDVYNDPNSDNPVASETHIYLAYDEKGNWTKRKSVMKEKGHKAKTSYETRTITYYPD